MPQVAKTINQKICVICGSDVAGRPRVRDPDGRYACKGGACEKKLVALPPVVSTPVEVSPFEDPAAQGGVDPLLAGLLDDAASAPAAPVPAPCAGCGRPLTPGTVVCVNCGVDSRTGAAAKTKVGREEAAPKRDESPRWAVDHGHGPSFGRLLLVFGAVFALLVLVGLTGSNAWLTSYVLICIGGIGAWGATVLAAFRNDQQLWGWCGILALPAGMPIGMLPIIGAIPALAFLFYALVINWEKWSKSLYLTNLAAHVASIVVLYVEYGGLSGLRLAE